MTDIEMWTLVASTPSAAIRQAKRAEAAGWHGIGVTDSQNLAGDAWVALTAMATMTTTLGLATTVTNPVTRHPAATAAAAASLDVLAPGRVALGIGRGDSALAHLGRAPVGLAMFERYVRVLRRFLHGEAIGFDELDFHEASAPDVATLGLADTPDASRLLWLDRDAPPVPVEVAATGPKVIALAACAADRVLLAVGADPARIAWGVETARAARLGAGLDPDGVSFGAYVNVAPHPDRDAGRALVSGGLSTFARFAVMHGSVSGPVDDEQRAVLEGLSERYDMRRHTRTGSAQADSLTPEFIDQYAIVGTADECVEQLEQLSTLGIDKFVVVGPSLGSDRDDIRTSHQLMTAEVLPALTG